MPQPQSPFNPERAREVAAWAAKHKASDYALAVLMAALSDGAALSDAMAEADDFLKGNPEGESEEGEEEPARFAEVPVGTVSHRSDGDYQKTGPGEWKKVEKPGGEKKPDAEIQRATQAATSAGSVDVGEAIGKAMDDFVAHIKSPAKMAAALKEQVAKVGGGASAAALALGRMAHGATVARLPEKARAKVEAAGKIAARIVKAVAVDPMFWPGKVADAIAEEAGLTHEQVKKVSSLAAMADWGAFAALSGLSVIGSPAAHLLSPVAHALVTVAGSIGLAGAATLKNPAAPFKAAKKGVVKFLEWRKKKRQEKEDAPKFADYEESEHPRDDDGKFKPAGGGGSKKGRQEGREEAKRERESLALRPWEHVEAERITGIEDPEFAKAFKKAEVERKEKKRAAREAKKEAEQDSPKPAPKPREKFEPTSRLTTRRTKRLTNN